MPMNAPIVSKPMESKADMKTGKASKAYNEAFWKQARNSGYLSAEIRNALQEGVDSEGGYLVPDEFEHTLVEALAEDNIFRKNAHTFTTSSGSHKIPVVATKGSASWIDEEGAIPESDDSFGQVSIEAHKVGTLIKVSEELLNDSAFNLEAYFTTEFARRIGRRKRTPSSMEMERASLRVFSIPLEVLKSELLPQVRPQSPQTRSSTFSIP